MYLLASGTSIDINGTILSISRAKCEMLYLYHSNLSLQNTMFSPKFVQLKKIGEGIIRIK